MRSVRRCDCGNVLGEEAAGYLLIRHGGREWLGIALSIRCEECGAVWRPDREVVEERLRPVAAEPEPAAGPS
jgi:hypothetical protein